MEQLSMEAVRERLDELEALVKENEGNADKLGVYWSELKHLRQAYDRMIMDSQGLGIQMMQDIMDKTPATRENYKNVPVATTEHPEWEAEEHHPEPDGDETPAAPPANITINVVQKEESVEPNFDDRIVSLMRSDGLGEGVQMPLDVRSRIEKAKKAPEASVDAIDQEKIRKMRAEQDAREKEEDEEEDETEAKKSHETNWYRSETQTLQKALLGRDIASSVLFTVGKWACGAIKKSGMLDTISKAIRQTLEKAEGGSMVAGMAAPKRNLDAREAYAKIVACNAAIQALQEEMQEANTPDKLVMLDKKLRDHYQHLAMLIMQSEGLGLKTEDMVRNKPDTRFDEGMMTPVVGATKKSQDDDLEKARKSGTKRGQIGGLKFVITYWDAEGGLNDEQARAVVQHVASTDKAVQKRLDSKIPPLKRMKDMDHVVSLNGDPNAPISSKGKKGKKSHWDARVGSPDHPGRHGGMRHVVRRKK